MSIEVHQLNVKMGTRQVLTDVSFSAPEGKITGFLGPNGSGKTTTLRTMLDLIPTYDGTVTYGGAPMQRLPRGPGGIATLFEHKGHDGLRRAIQHLSMIAHAVGADRQTVADAVDRVGLSGAIRQRIRTYSLGMKQRLGLAEILISKPKFILLDEPMNGLDPQGIQWLRQLLLDLVAEGAAVLVSSHMLNEAEKFVDEIVLIQHGRIIRQSELAALAQFNSLEEAYLQLTSQKETSKQWQR